MRAAVTAVRARPAHLLLAALLAGLVLGPRAPWALLAVAPALPFLSERGPVALAALALLAVGAALGPARLAALSHPVPAPGVGHVVRDEVVLLERPRATAVGWRVLTMLGDARVLALGRGAPPALDAGEIAAATGALRAPSDREGWLRPWHVAAVLDVERLAASGRRRGGLAGRLDGVRGRAERALARGLAPDDAALLQGMVLGDDAGLSRRARDALRAAGLGHLMAASGANIALLAALAGALAAGLGLPRTPRLGLILLLIAVYVPLAGSGPSIQRAGVMGAAGIAAALASRPALRWYALLLAAVVTLTLDPLAVEAPGWQLSFAAVAAIAALAAPLRDGLTRRGVPAALAEAAALSASATLGTAPVAAAVFGGVSLVALPANLVVAPLVAPVTWLGMLAAVGAQILPVAAGPLVMAAAVPVRLILLVGTLGARLPGTAAAIPVPAAAGALAAAVLGVRVRRVRRLLGPALALAAAAGLFLALHGRRAVPAPPAPGTLRVTFLDVGQGDATLLQVAGHAALVDAGPPGGAALRGLRAAGVRALDLLVGTHAQADHLGGADEVLRAMPVAAVLDGRDGVREPQGDELAAAAAARGTRLLRPVAGTRLRLGELVLDVLWPPATAPVPGTDPNDRAVVLRASAAGARVLLAADAESNVVGPLTPGPVELVKASHHGSEDEGLPRLLGDLRPRLAVIEVGAHNTYGHPTPQALRAFAQAGVPVRRTDRDGPVRVDVAQGRLLVRTHAR